MISAATAIQSQKRTPQLGICIEEMDMTTTPQTAAGIACFNLLICQLRQRPASALNRKRTRLARFPASEPVR
jgi:hypothetical protein